MTNLDTVQIHSRAITALFETHDAAQRAVVRLESAGIPSRHITLVTGNERASTSTKPLQDTGFMASLKDMFMPDEDRYAYAEGLRRGGYLISVNTDEANYDRVLDILDIDGSVDMAERETAWKAEGWNGYEQHEMPLSSTAPVAATFSTAAPSKATQDDVISLYEENLRVGKRDVNHGRVRLRSYVVETPVTQQVSLHSETVQVDRKSVDRPVTAADAFQDRVIEVEEYTEEAVISKTARVTEEVSLRKDVTDRVETVTDTLRHTEVEINDSREKAAGTVRKFVAASDAAMIIDGMDVIASDGTKIGTVDHLEGLDRIKLAKSTSPDGQHHNVPLSWVDHVDQHVHLNKTTASAKAGR